MLKPVSNRSVTINDAFWNRALSLVRDVVIPYQWDALNDRVPDAEPSRCIANFEIAAGRREGEFHGFVFQDSDLYKWLESVAFALESKADARLEAQADSAIELVAAAQMADGYLNTYFQIIAPNGRWTNLREAHEMYCAGHLFEAAVAYAEATGKRKLLDVALRLADHIDSRFGPEDGKSKGYPGHQEIEIGLVKLWQFTGERRYLDLALHFIKLRGGEPFFFAEERSNPDQHIIWSDGKKIDRPYTQSHLPPVAQETAVGHAVRACYMYAAMADLALHCGDEALKQACGMLYNNIADKQLYVTGGVGAAHHGEAFTGDYDLPNDSAYAETCASIALMMFCRRMNALDGDSRYIDTLERALYNTVLSGMSLTGREFFYVNPLEVHPSSCAVNPGLSHVKIQRQRWFSCACCPPNAARTLMSLGSYAYAEADDGLYINLYISSEVKTGKGNVSVTTDYPNGGAVSIKADGRFKLRLRSPSMSPIMSVVVAGCSVNVAPVSGYVEINVDGAAHIELTLDVKARLVYTHPLAHHTSGKVAVQVGPVVYCAEAIDNASPPNRFFVPHNATIEQVLMPNGLPSELSALSVEAYRIEASDTELYSTVPPHLVSAPLTLIPYHLWGNRGEGDMAVFLGSLPDKEKL